MTESKYNSIWRLFNFASLGEEFKNMNNNFKSLIDVVITKSVNNK